jgi:hypothetical protein
MEKNRLGLLLVLCLVSCGKNTSDSTVYTPLDSKKGREAFTELKEENTKETEDNKHVTLTSEFTLKKTTDTDDKAFKVTRRFRLSLANGYAETEFKETYPSGSLTISHILNGETMYLYREVELTSDGTKVLIANPTYTPVLSKDYDTNADLGDDYKLDTETYNSLASNTDFVMAEGADGSIKFTYTYTDSSSRTIQYTVIFDSKGRFSSREFSYTQTVDGVSYQVDAKVSVDYTTFAFTVPNASAYTAYGYQVYYQIGMAIRKLYSSSPLSLPGAVDPSQA